MRMITLQAFHKDFAASNLESGTNGSQERVEKMNQLIFYKLQFTS